MPRIAPAFERPLGLFVITAGWGAAIAYSSALAWPKLAAIIGGAALALIIARAPWDIGTPQKSFPHVLLALGLGPALLGAWFLASNDWSHPVAKVAWLSPLRDLLAAFPRALPLAPLHPNVAGGLLAMAVPLQAAALDRWRASAPPDAIRSRTIWRIAALMVTGAALLMSSLRGAWLALALVLAGRAAGRAWLAVKPRTLEVVVTTLAALLLAVVIGARLAPIRPDRWLVWHNAWDLAWDYAFTGLGLGCFTMPYSSYALLVHVPHTTHAHNLLLDLWLEQGPIAPLAFLWIAARALLSRHDGRMPDANTGERDLRDGARVSLAVLLLHSLVDDPYYGYGGAGAVALFVPAAVLLRGPHRPRSPRGALWWAAPAVLAALALALPPVRAQAFANLGALRQTREEMSRYAWPQWALQDSLRRSDEIDLGPALSAFDAALQLDPSNPTANRRRGQIELSRGEVRAARQHLEAAYHAAPRQNATRQMLGETLALDGDVPAALDLWRTVPRGQDQLGIRRYWYRHLGDPRAPRIAAAVSTLDGKR